MSARDDYPECAAAVDGYIRRNPHRECDERKMLDEIDSLRAELERARSLADAAVRYATAPFAGVRSKTAIDELFAAADSYRAARLEQELAGEGTHGADRCFERLRVGSMCEPIELRCLMAVGHGGPHAFGWELAGEESDG